MVHFEDAAKCRGIDMFWSLLASVVVDWETTTIQPFAPPLLYYLCIDNDRAISVFSAPDPPVP
ncbi:hypothetical protein [Novipirellula galeiformis]|uniref:hypothetical protein n=1 Tax=Novipirellula galeiformis TaxID=2528004 RepID=UPI0011B56DEE|nr:hypothetical protein [Novipirellula galeiformis]